MITVTLNSRQIYEAISKAALEVLRYNFSMSDVIDIRIDGADIMQTFETATVTFSSGSEKVVL